jgi:carbon-monoxide dehydrogenase medium subunit
LLRAIEVPVLPAEARWGHWKFCRKVGEFSKATACVLALPGRAPRAVLSALDGPPLVIEDASMLAKDPVAEATRIVAAFPELDAWRRALAETALRRAVERAGGA